MICQGVQNGTYILKGETMRTVHQSQAKAEGSEKQGKFGWERDCYSCSCDKILKTTISCNYVSPMLFFLNPGWVVAGSS